MARVRSDGPLLTRSALRLCRHVAEHYLAPPGLVVRAMLPPGLLERIELVGGPDGGRRLAVPNGTDAHAGLLDAVREQSDADGGVGHGGRAAPDGEPGDAPALAPRARGGRPADARMAGPAAARRVRARCAGRASPTPDARRPPRSTPVSGRPGPALGPRQRALLAERGRCQAADGIGRGAPGRAPRGVAR